MQEPPRSASRAFRCGARFFRAGRSAVILRLRVPESGILAVRVGQKRRVRALLHERGARWFLESPTNQQFIILEKGEYARLGKQICLSFWDTYDEDHVVVRLATSWATTQEDLDALAAAL